MLFINALINGLVALVLFALDSAGEIGGGAMIALIINTLIGVTLWRGKAQWQRSTLAWMVIGLLFWSVRALVAQEWHNFAMQVACSSAPLAGCRRPPHLARNHLPIAHLVQISGEIGRRWIVRGHQQRHALVIDQIAQQA
jgi:hypothetical protein